MQSTKWLYTVDAQCVHWALNASGHVAGKASSIKVWYGIVGFNVPLNTV